MNNLCVLSYVYEFLDPWTRRQCLSINTFLNNSIRTDMKRLDVQYYRGHKGRTRLPACHDTALFFRQPNDTSLCNHMCETCPTPCHNNNSFGIYHWDITSFWVQPFKCTRCGRIYIDRYIACAHFFLRPYELKVLDSYVFHNQSVYYELYHVQWLSLFVNRTIKPLYRYSKGREKRERWVERYLFPVLENEYSVWDARVLTRCLPFRSFLNNKKSTLRQFRSLVYRFTIMLPMFMDLFRGIKVQERQLLSPDQSFFVDMRQKTMCTENYQQFFLQSFEFYMCVALLNNPDESTNNAQMIQFAIEDIRQQMFHVYTEKKHPELRGILTVTHSEHVSYRRFIHGQQTLKETHVSFILYKNRLERKTTIHDWLRDHRGVHAPSIQCNTLERYIHEGDISIYLVWRCIKTHVSSIRLQDTTDCIIPSSSIEKK